MEKTCCFIGHGRFSEDISQAVAEAVERHGGGLTSGCEMVILNVKRALPVDGQPLIRRLK